MMRSYSYAAYAALFAFTVHAPDDYALLEPWADTWQHWAADAFLKGYLAAIDGDAAAAPSDAASAAAAVGVRAGQGAVRAGVRVEQPAGVGPDPARSASASSSESDQLVECLRLEINVAITGRVKHRPLKDDGDVRKRAMANAITQITSKRHDATTPAQPKTRRARAAPPRRTRSARTRASALRRRRHDRPGADREPVVRLGAAGAEPSDDDIRRRAYERYLERGGNDNGCATFADRWLERGEGRS